VSAEAERAAAELIVEGRVQGVGYRQYTRRIAERHGIVGYVMNLPDGRVRIVAEATRADIEAMVPELERGPRLGLVTRVTVTWRTPRGEFGGFGIRYHGHDAS
jgi:acylphosphatase